MLDRTRRLWEKQNQHVGDRHRLFAAIGRAVDASTVLYPGSFVDVAPSFVWPSVTYVDVDRRAEQFHADEAGVAELIDENGADSTSCAVRFIRADYQQPLDVADGSVDLLISLYAGFVSEHCTKYLRGGGMLLVNPSHGDAALASIDSRYRLHAVVTARSGRYSVSTKDLNSYLVPKRAVEVTSDLIHETGRGIAYTKSPFAYLFERVG